MAQAGAPATISVILPYHNRAETLLRAVQSVLAQTHHQLVLYLINDGSTDESSDVAGSCDDPRVVHVDLPSKRGAAHARNVGLTAAETDLVSFMDSDDAWLPSKLETQLRYLRDAQATDERTAVTGCGWRVDGSSQPPPEFRPGPFVRVDVHSRVTGLRTPMLLVDRAVAAEQARFDESLPALLDRDYVMSCLANDTKVVVVPQILALVTRGRPDHIAQSTRVALAMEQLIAKYEHDLLDLPELRSWYSYRAAREHLTHHDLRRAAPHIRPALTDHAPQRLAHLLLGAVAGRNGLALAQRLIPLSN